ncbi:MAG: hypothetical protein HRT37_07475 [Alteromonadaceae bacterium]|nr:hypothetical protein [Alteromonadaceae bacterium]
MALAIPILNEFIEMELERLERYGEKSKERSVGFNALNELFLEILAHD